MMESMLPHGLQELSPGSIGKVKNKHLYVTIKFKYLAIAAYLFLLIPILIFFVTWLRLYIGIPAAIVLLAGFYALLKSDYLDHKGVMVLPVESFLLIAFIFLVWMWLAGQGGFYYQTTDYHARNAIFRDLITFSWPVVYPETGNALVYYLLHWIVPALFGKAFGWIAGNVALMLWTYTGTMISFLLVVYLCKSYTSTKLLLVGLMYMTWSGLHDVGAVIMSIYGQGTFGLGNFDGWLDQVQAKYAFAYHYSGNETLLSHVFNQAIASWVAVPLFLENRKVRNYAFIGLCVFPYAPLPFIGFTILLLASAVQNLFLDFKKKFCGMIIRELFSTANISAILTIYVIFLLYFQSNVSGQKMGLYTPIDSFDSKRIVLLLLFCLLEFGLYMILIGDEFKSHPLFWIIGILLTAIPLFRIGYGRDFCMRASIPALFVLMIFVMQYALGLKDKCTKNFTRSVLFVVVLTLGMINPVLSIAGKMRIVNTSDVFPIVADRIITYSDKKIGDEGFDIALVNVLVPDPDNTFFYKYLARK